MIEFENFSLVVNSEICLNENQCYNVKTYLPWYITAILFGSAILIIKEFTQ